MDALDLLTADHNRVRGLFARFREAHDSDDTKTMGQIAEKIFEELRVHTTIEERVFYPAVHDLDELAETIDEANEEHHVVDVLIEELKSIDAGKPQWLAKMTVLMENVEHHAEEEEQELFPKVRTISDDATRAEWAEQLEAMKAELGAPTSADAADMPIDELRRKASEQHIPGRSQMSREVLAATVDPR